MILRDRIDIVNTDGSVVRAGVPAYVGNATAMGIDTPRTPYGDITELRAIVGPELDGVVADQVHRIRWRGTLYTVPYPAVPRMRRGRLHHVSIPLSRITGA